MQFFKYSRLDTFKRIWEKMQSGIPSAFVSSNDEGVQRVLNEKCASIFFNFQICLPYGIGLTGVPGDTELQSDSCRQRRAWLQRLQHCLAKGFVLLKRQGGVGSKWREKLTRQILDFNEKGIMMMLKSTWWKSSQPNESAFLFCLLDVSENVKARRRTMKGETLWAWTTSLDSLSSWASASCWRRPRL